jgi:hypothetical protein
MDYSRDQQMTQILIPTSSFADWQKLLAKPDLHWKAGFSAMTLARAWEEAKNSGFPAEIAALLKTAERSDWGDLRPLLAIPEYRVSLPGGARGSQTDLMALARGDKGLIAIAVEGKVDESLGPTLKEKREEESPGVDVRIKYLCETLGISNDCPGTIRYQLLHRTVSAIQIARDFFAESAVMIVHSFSPDKKWLGDFQDFATLLGADAQPGRLSLVGKRGGVQLYLGWAVGDQKFRSPASQSPQRIG